MAGDWQQFIFRGALRGGTPAVRQHRGRGEPIPGGPSGVSSLPGKWQRDWQISVPSIGFEPTHGACSKYKWDHSIEA